jgi:hypothetical protein
MILNRLEALADAIAFYYLAHDPVTTAYQNRNPGMLRAISLKHARDENGYRLFNAYIDGYQALLYDLQLKASGKSFARLPDNATINDLMKAYGHTGALVGERIAKFVRKALQNSDIAATTPLTFFLEK